MEVSSLIIDHYLDFFKIGDGANLPDNFEIVSGGATGIDTCGEMFANELGIPVKRFEADWDNHGRAAGPVRNREMAEYGDALLLIWDGSSKGSKNMKLQMLGRNKPIYEVVMRKI